MGTLTITLESVLGSPDEIRNNLQLFPNPTNGNVNISSATTIQSIEIYNVLGAKVYGQKINSKRSNVDISSLNSGVYLFRIKNTDGSSVVKKVVKR